MSRRRGRFALGLTGSLVLAACATTPGGAPTTPYADYVWPPPPAEARIQLVDIIRGRLDVESESGFQRALLGASPADPYRDLSKPVGVAFDAAGRVLVTDIELGALLRMDRAERRMDVLGTRGRLPLQQPMGLAVGASGTIFVADAGLRQVVAFDPEGGLVAAYGAGGQLSNPTDVELGPDGSTLYVADSRGNKIVVFALDSGEVVREIGSAGFGPGEFSAPTSLAFGPDRSLFVVDQLNARVQILSEEGDYLDEFGGRGTGFGSFVRPKDVAVDENGFIYVSDGAFNNFQIFDVDLTLLTFVGGGGTGPGQFQSAFGVAVQGDRLAMVDQLGRRVQLFRYLIPPGGE